MRLSMIAFVTLTLAVAANAAASRNQQTSPAPAATMRAATIPSYPDSTSGLEHLVKDILKAQKAGDGVHAQELIDSLILPDYQGWYVDAFDHEMAESGIASYKASVSSLPAQLARYFLSLQQNQVTISAVRFDETCDDNASDHTFGILQSRLRSVPLYELRFIKDGKFSRLFSFVYVDGGFRFALLPEPEKVAPHRDNSAVSKHECIEVTVQSGSGPVQVVRQGGAVTASRLIKRVQPEYPEIARREGIQGTIRMRAIIGADGAISGVRVISGACSLSKSAYDAVKKWKYSPTLLLGKPIEVDTTIDVIYSLRQ